jgi:hypothetical protein
VRDRVFDVEAASNGRSAPPEPSAIDLLDTLRERRGRRNRPITEEDEIGGAPDPVREAIDSLLSRAETKTTEPPPAAHPARSRPQDARDGEVLVLPDADPIGPLPSSAPQSPKPPNPPKSKPPVVELDSEPEPEPSEEDAPVPAGAGRRPMPSANRKQRRASVPSWDDIVFGQRRD